MNKKTLVVQSNRLIEAKYRLSVEEQKIIKILISQIQQNDEDFRDYEFRVKDLADILGMGHKDIYRVLPKITERLMSRVLKFYNPETQTLLQTSWLSSAEYQKGQGTVALCFDPKLKPLLLHLQSYFTKYELGQVMQFKGQYTIRFFELRKSFLGRHKKEVVFSLQDLWEMLGLRKNEYKEFFNFKNRVLESAKVELLEKTGKSFSWEAIRQGRGGKVVGVRFMFDEEDNAPTDKAIEEYEPPKKEIRQLALVTEEAQTPEGEAVAGLVDVGVSPKTAQTLTDKHGAEYVQEKIELLSQRKDVKSGAGFVVSAIRENWVDDKAEKKKLELEEKKEKRMVNIRIREIQELKQKYISTRWAVASGIFASFSEEKKEIWREEFRKNQPFFSRLLRSTLDFNSGAFRAFAMSKMNASLPTVEEFLQNEGIDLSSEDLQLWEKG